MVTTRNLAILTCLICAWSGGRPSGPVLDGHEVHQDPLRSPAAKPGFEEPSNFSTDDVRRVFFELRLAEEEPVRGLTYEATVKNSARKTHLHYTIVVANGDVAKATVVEAGDRYDVAITLSPEGAAKMTSATQRHVGRPIAIILDGDVVALLTVRKPLAGEVVCSGGFTRMEAMKIAAGLEKW